MTPLAPRPLVLVAFGDAVMDAWAWGVAASAQSAREFVLVTDRQPPAGGSVDLTVAGRWLVMPVPADECYWSSLAELVPTTIEHGIVIRWGTALPSHALQRLDSLAMTADMIFPLSAQHPLSSAFLLGAGTPQIDVHAVDRWCNHFALHQKLTVPLMAGWTALVNFAACRVLPAKDDHELAMRLSLHGKGLQVSDALYVDDTAFDSAIHWDHLAPAVKEAFQSRHPLTALRHPLTELGARGEEPGMEVAEVKPAVLHVSHSWGGGLARWIDDYATGDSGSEHWVLRSVGDWDAAGKSLTLSRVGPHQPTVCQWTLTTPIVSTAVAHQEYSEILAEIADHLPLSLIMVSTLIGHGMAVYEQRVEVLQVLHDFYPWCPPLYATWETPCDHCDSSRLARCLAENPAHRFFRDESPQWLEAMREAFVTRVRRHAIPLIAPSESVRTRWQRLAPGLAEHPISVIEHGLDQRLLARFESHRPPVDAANSLNRDPLTMVIVGSLAQHKGGALLKEALPELLALGNVTLLGCGDDDVPIADSAGVTRIPRYERDELPAALGSLRPDVALLLSVVPETFSYTLSELRAAAIPVIATRVGAFADRIEHGVDGWLVEPQAHDLVSQARALASNRGLIQSVKGNLMHLPHRALTDMVADYQNLLSGGTAPLFRPRWPRRDAPRRAGRIAVASETTYAQALGSFLDYSIERARQSPRLSPALGRVATAILRRVRSKLPE